MPRDRLPALIRCLAELESLSTASARWGFILGCALATVRLQPGSVVLQAGSAPPGSRRWIRALSVRESDVLALQRAENVGSRPALSGALTGSNAGGTDRRVPEVDLPPFDFSGLPEPHRPR